MAGEVDARIRAIAQAQEGRVGRWQLTQAGVGAGAITRRIGGALVATGYRGIYAYGHAEATPHSAELAALLTRGPAALIDAHSAAAMWRFRGTPGGVVDVLVPAYQGGRGRPGIRIHRSGDPLRLEPRYVGGVPVVAPAWALLGIAGALGARDLERALDEAFSLGIVSRDEVTAVLARQPTAPGSGTLRALMRGRLVGNVSRSAGQERLLALIREAGLPDPEMDARIGGGFSVDCLWRQPGVAAEYDSFRWHSSRGAWARDRRKDAHCRDRGIDLIRITEEDLQMGRLRTAARLAQRIYAPMHRAA